jgi:hypothetical protein
MVVVPAERSGGDKSLYTYTGTLIMNKRLILILLLLITGVFCTNAQALEISKGELTGSFDTTISYGAAWRAHDRDDDYVGKVVINPAVGLLDNPGQRAAPGRWSVNNDDGNKNYADGGTLVSHTIKFTSELDLRWRNFGGFTRFMGFYDFANVDQEFLSEEAEKRVGKDVRLLDLYVWGEHEVGSRFLNWRLGRQVVSWGESTFIQGGINVINPVDVSRLRAAGAELKEAFEGVNMLYGSIDLTPSVSLEALYMFEYRNIIPDPAGAYFSTNDIATPGGSYVMLGWGTTPQPVINQDLYQPVCFENDFPAADTPYPPQTLGAICGGATFPRTESVFPKDSGQYGLALRWFAENLNSTEFGFYFLNYHSRLPLINGAAITSPAPGAKNTGQYWTEYPEDINLWGASFNSTVGTWALSGEVSYRPNAPLQVDDVEILFAGLTPLNDFIPPVPYYKIQSQLGQFGWGEVIKGWEEHKSWQAQATTTKLFGPGNFLRASQIAFVTEAGMNYVSDLPDKDVLRFNGPGTDTGGGGDVLTTNANNPYTEPAGFADDFSWGYRMLLRADYYNAWGPVTISPRIAWAHDVKGTTPGPGGSFIDGRKTISLGLGFNYLQKWIFDLAYTDYMGGGGYNLLYDRDFFAASVRYSF